jgi:glycosyltransferase involved in cell wall biosynthesis
MRLCFLGDIRSIHTKRWIEYFTDHHEVHLISLTNKNGEEGLFLEDELISRNIVIHKIPRTIPGMLFSPIISRRIVDSIKPDVIHAHYATQYGFLAALSRFHPYLLTVWGSDVFIDVKKSKLFRFFVKYAIKNADVLTCDGENTRKALIDLGADRENIRMIYFGVDTKRYNPGKRKIDAFDSVLGKGNHKVVIYPRGFTEVYDPETVIRAIPQVIEKVPDVKFLLAREGLERDYYKKIVDASSYGNSVYFIGNIPQENIPIYLASSDVYISMSLSDSGLSASTAEAMSCGVPVISSDVGDVALWIEDGKNGFIVQKGDYMALADKIIELFKNAALKSEIGENARKVIEEKQDYFKEMNKIEQIYYKLKEMFV